jgi:amino acid adenylation domain-containing protein
MLIHREAGDGTSIVYPQGLHLASASNRQGPSAAELVLAVANSSPEAIAISSCNENLTYGELAIRARRMASYLIKLGVGPEVPVGLCLERSFDFIISALAVLLSGAAYLPLDPMWPAARSRKILNQAQASLLITHGAAAEGLAEPGTRIINLARDANKIGSYDLLAAPVAVTPETLAYLIYTSGSTGEPKGVEVTQGNLSNLISWHRDAFDIRPSDRASHLAGLGFDAAVWEIWPNLATGSTLVLVDEQTRTSADLLRDWLVKECITVAFVPTVLAESLFGQTWPSETKLRYLLTGGEALHRRPAPGLPFTTVNNYGPTECTVVATSGVVGAAGSDGLAPSIGKPIAGTQIRILDSERRPVPTGQIGEIYIAGAGVARGYRNNPSGTAERFLCASTEPTRNSRMYRTGDLGCFLADGRIIFRGRVDSQEQIQEIGWNRTRLYAP